MSETMNTNMELQYFSLIKENPEQFLKVEPNFFKNDEIQFVYQILREHYLTSKKKEIPTNTQILSMVQLRDTENKITKEALKVMLTSKLDEYQNEFLEPRFKAWKLSNGIRGRVMNSVETVRGMDDSNYDSVIQMASTLKGLYSDIMMIDDDDSDLGSNFYDPEAHKQNNDVNKLKSGWASVDNILGGGWDLASLNVIMGETNIGKSLWMQNIAANALSNNKNVVYVTLEMAKQKCIKRVGSMLLGIHPTIYDEKAKDTQYIQNKINEFKATINTDSLFADRLGELWVKKFNTSDCTITDLDNYLKKLEDTKNMKIDMVLVDYLNIMSIEKGLNIQTNLYQKGKHLAEGLRYLADKHNTTFITATQTDRAVWGASDIKIDSIPESKAIAETADTVWAIIRTTEMKRQNMYRLKNLKLRDGECKESQILFTFKPETLTIENDRLV